MGLKGRVVLATEEFKRIRDLPRRVWTPEATARAVEHYTERFKQPEGQWKLFPVQAKSLAEVDSTNGLIAPIKVGGGKTLLAFLIYQLLREKYPHIKHGCLVIPAHLRAKTLREAASLARHWRIYPLPEPISYQELGRVTAARKLEDWPYQVFILDEAHMAKNRKAGVTRRLVRAWGKDQEPLVVAMSGTLIRNSVDDAAHLSKAALKQFSPIPRNHEAYDWACALDDSGHMRERVGPGALLDFCDPHDPGTQIERTRRGFQRRFLETPGVVSSGEDEDVTCTITVMPVEYTVNTATEANYQTLRDEWLLANGAALSSSMDVWRHSREYALGLHYEWDPPGPLPWKMARKVWAGAVRDVLSESRTLDTEKQVADACMRGEMDPKTAHAWNEWAAIRGTFEPNPVPVWHDDSALRTVEAWLQKHSPAIVWTTHTFFARELARRTGLPYYGRNGIDKLTGKQIEDETGNRSVIASTSSNATGRNLQVFRCNLLTAPTGSATLMEQLIGRTHRTGQRADEVEVHILLGCYEHWDAVEKCIATARSLKDLTGHSQKILLADIDWPDSLRGRVGPRWKANAKVGKQVEE